MAQNGGKTLVSKKVYATYKKVMQDLADKQANWYYSQRRAEHIIDFIEHFCHHSKGKLGGQPIRLELWEKAMLAIIFGFIDIEGNRKYRRALLIIGKKNGKSLLASAAALYLLVGDGEPGPEIYAVAAKRDQAKIIWQESKRMVKKSPALLRRIKPLTYELTSEEYNDGVYKPLSSDSDTLDGLNIHGVLMDEFHQWKNGEPLYNIMTDGITAREQLLIFMTSTAGTIREDIYDEIYDEAETTINGYHSKDGYKDERFIFFYELDKKSEWRTEKYWVKANPGLGVIKNKGILAEKVAKAKQNSRLVKNLVCKEFNIRETSTESWLSFDELVNTDTFDIQKLKPKYGIVGTGLSQTTDLTCATVLFRVPDDANLYVKQMYWLPEDRLEARAHEDNIPYVFWKGRGLLRTSQGNKVYYRDIVDWLEELQAKDDIYIYHDGYDSWSAHYFVKDLEARYGAETFEPVIQGKKTLSSPTRQSMLTAMVTSSPTKVAAHASVLMAWRPCWMLMSFTKNIRRTI